MNPSTWVHGCIWPEVILLFRVPNRFSYNHIILFPFSAKMARLKQAKEEAEKEVAEFRAQMQAEFQRKVAEVKRTIKYNINHW